MDNSRERTVQFHMMNTKNNEDTIRRYKEVATNFSQTTKQLIDGITYQDGDSTKPFRFIETSIKVDKWKPDGSAQIIADIPEISTFGVSMWLSPEQAQQLRDPKNANDSQVYSMCLMNGKLKENKSGQFLYDYWWNPKIFDDVENPRVTPFPVIQNPNQVKEMDLDKSTTELFGSPATVTSSPPRDNYGKTQLEINLAVAWKTAGEILVARGIEGLDMKYIKAEQMSITIDLMDAFQELRGHYGLI